MKDKFKRKLARSLLAFRLYGADIVLLSVVTGVFAGVIVTFYNICTGLGEEYSRALYELVRAHPAFIPLLLVGLAAGAVAIGTLVRFVPMIRGSGASKVHMRIASPPVRFPCYYGIDTPSSSELIAAQTDIQELCRKIDADSLEYISCEDLCRAIGLPQEELCTACFDGNYLEEEEKNDLLGF